RRAPTEMGHVGNIDALRDHELEDRLPQEVASHAYRYRPDPDDLAALFAFDGTPDHRFDVEMQESEVARFRRPRLPRRAGFGERDQGVEHIRLSRLVPVVGPRLGEHRGDDRRERGLESGSPVDRSARDQVPGTFGIGEGPTRTLGADTAIGSVRITVGG